MITLLKLVDGTEIVGEMVQNGDKIVISNPLQINYFVRTPASMPVVSLHRYMPFAGNTSFVFFKDHIINQAEPGEGIREYYTATLKDIIEYTDPEINTSLLEKAGAMDSESSDVAQALIERMVKKPILN